MTLFLGTLWCSIKKIEAHYLSDSELWIALHPMQGNQASSRARVMFHGISRVAAEPGVYSRVTVGMAIRNSTSFHQANQGSLPVRLGTRNCSARTAGEAGLISQRTASLMVFLELRREPGVCSRVMAGVAIKNFVCSSTSGIRSSYDVHLRYLNYA